MLQADEAVDEVWEAEDSAVPERRKKSVIWQDASERASWKKLAAANSIAKIAYAAAALLFHSQAPLAEAMRLAKKK